MISSLSHFVMKVFSCRLTCITHTADNLRLPDMITSFYPKIIEMCVDRFKSIRMFYNYSPEIPVAVI